MRKLFTLLGTVLCITGVHAQAEPTQLLQFYDIIFNASASGDLNGDGLNDFIGGNDHIIWFEGNGTTMPGTMHFTGAVLPAGCSDIQLADINSDGALDIYYLSSTAPYSLGWLKNPGDGTDNWTNYSIPGSYSNIIGFFDIDGDGDKDLMNENSVTILNYRENIGNEFTIIHDIPDSYTNLYMSQVYDFDGDGDMDWVANLADCCYRYFRNNLNGTFTVTYLKTNEYENSVYVTDVNNDGYADVVYYDGDFEASTWNPISSTFSTPFYLGDVNYFEEFEFIDIDGDNDQDLAFIFDDVIGGVTTYNVKYIQNTGGTLAINAASLQTLIVDIPSGTQDFGFADIDSDNDPELVMETPLGVGNDLYVYPNFDGVFEAPGIFYYETSPQVEDLICFDVDGDPDNDLLLAFNNGLLAWYEYDHVAAAFNEMHTINFTESRPTPTNIKKKDLDSDGDFDVVSSFTGGGGTGRTFYHLNNGSGNFLTYTIDDYAFSNVWTIDGDADGDFDIAALINDDYNYIRYYENTGNPEDLFNYVGNLTSSYYWNSFVQLDVDADGDDDLVGVRNSSAYAWVLTNTNGAATFGAASALFTMSTSDAKSIFTSDFDNNGTKDFAYVSGGGYMWLATPSGATYTSTAIGTFDPAPLYEGSHTSVFDLNMDGLEDFVYNKVSGGSGYKLATGAGTFTSGYDAFSVDYGRFGYVDAGSIVDFIGINSEEMYVNYNILMLPPSFDATAPTATWIEEGTPGDSLIISFEVIPQTALNIQITPEGAIDAGMGAGVAYSITVMNDSTALTPKVIHYTVPDDAVVEDLTNYGVSVQADPDTWGPFAGLLNIYSSFTITDNDLGIFFTPNTVAFTEGTTADTVFAHLNMVPDAVTSVMALYNENYTTGITEAMLPSYTIPAGIAGIEQFRVTLESPNDYLINPDINTNMQLNLISADPVMNGFISSEVSVTIFEDDYASVNISLPASDISEGTEPFFISVQPQTALTGNLTVTLAPDAQLDLGAGAGVAVSVEFNAIATLPTAQIVAALAAEDLLPEGTHSGTITVTCTSDDPFYATLTSDIYTVVISDNDLPQGITVNNPAIISMIEGAGSTNMDFALWTNTLYGVQIIATPSSGIDLGEGAGVATEIYFSPIEDATIAKVLSIDAANNTIIGPAVADHTITFEVITADPQLVDAVIAPVSISISDDDILQNIVITEPVAGVYMEDIGITEALTISTALAQTPNMPVDITFTPDMQLDLGAGAGVAVTQHFEGADALAAQAIQILIVDDYTFEDMHTGIININITTADPVVAAMSIDPIVINIDDDDLHQSLIFTAPVMEVAEGATGLSLEFALESVPNAEVTVVFSPTEDVDLGSGYGAVHMVTLSADASATTTHVLTMNVLDNWINDGDRDATWFIEFTTDDPAFAGYTYPSVPLTIIDDEELQGVNIAAPDAGAFVEGDTNIAIDLSLFTAPHTPVTISANFDATQIQIEETLVFNADATATETQSMYVDIIDDVLTEGDHYAVIEYTITTTDIQFDGYSIPMTVINIADNDGETAITDMKDQIPSAVSTVAGLVYLHLPASFLNNDYVVYDVQGNVIANGNINNNTLQINLQQVASGIYYFNCYTATGKQTISILKAE